MEKTDHHTKKQTLLKGVSVHILIYALIALTLAMMGVPILIIFMVVMILFWGLIVMSYAFYYHK
jgi:fatty acid desaturase